MMKKTLSFVMVLLALAGMVFADVTVKDLGNGTAEVTFFYGNPRASEVVIAGDFTNWADGAEPMTLIEGKGWEYKKVVPLDTVMKYKFISDGNWTPDLKAPDTIDDGFGGKNGLVEVAALAAAASGGSGDGAGAAVAQPKLKFQTWSMVGYQTKFDVSDGFEVAQTGIGAKSYLKFGGEAVKNVPVYVEVALFENDGFANLYNKGSLSLKDGVQNFFTDLAFDPLYWTGGQKSDTADNAVGATGWSYLGHMKIGITTPYVEWNAGAKYAKLPPHTNVSWTTLDQDWEAGYSAVGGFSAFQLGQAVRQIGDVSINAMVMPNRSADRAGKQYGLAAWASAQIGSNYVDLQYNGAYGKTYDTIFDEIMEMDIIAGYSGSFGPIGVKLNALVNQYGSYENADGTKTPYAPPSSDVGNVSDDADFIDNLAANAQVAFSNDIISATLGYRLRGVQASMMYVEGGGADGNEHIKDQLGDRDHQRIWINANSTPVEFLNVGAEIFLEMSLDKDKEVVWKNDADNMQLGINPWVGLDLNDLAGIDAKVDLYTKLYYNTSDKQPLAADSQFKMQEIGVKFAMGALNDAIGGIEVLYGLDNDSDAAMFNTLLASVKLPMSITAQAGFGIRTAKNDNPDPASPFGFYLGAFMPLKVLAKPTLYAQFVYGMDPYKGFGDGQEAYNLDGYTLDSGVGNYDGAAAMRVGLRWDL